MLAAKLLLAVCAAAAGQSDRSDGVVRGVVVNASDGDRPVGGTEVVLRIQLEGQFVPLAETTADAEGEFVFRNLPVGEHYHYLPGANRDGVHYPGPRLRLTSGRSGAGVELAVYDSVTGPNPLVIRQYEITIRPEPGALKVTESMLVANPSSTCYVGRAAGKGAKPVTLRLAIPSDFERTTFHKEFFGRRFSLVKGELVTSIPWPPGRRKLKFTYVLPNTQTHRLWERPLDLPCSHVRLCVRTAEPDAVSCNLQPTAVQHNGEMGEVTFESSGRTLPAGHVVRLELGRLPVPWMVYGRWLALAIMVHLIAGAGLVMIRRRHRAGR